MITINEIFVSIQGEGSNIGRRALFVRFAGCNLSCEFCDTAYAWSTFSLVSLEDLFTTITGTIERENLEYIVFTGGEPLLQRKLIELVKYLIEYSKVKNFPLTIGIETNGTQDIQPFLPFSKNISLVVSPKVNEGSFNDLHPSFYSCIDTPVASWKETTLKLLYPFYISHGHEYKDLNFTYYYVQPIADGNKPIAKEGVEMITSTLHLHGNHWRFSPQLHKILEVR